MQMIDPKSKRNLIFVSQQAYDQMQRIPTVDAEPVIRCADCLCWEAETGFCHQNSQYYCDGESWDIYQLDDFCSRGERRG